MESVVKPIIKFLFKIPLVRVLLFVFCGSLLGYITSVNFTEEVRFSLDGKQAVAQVRNSEAGKRGIVNVVLTYESDGEVIDATMLTWFYRPQAGEQVAILYRPDKPHLVHLDSFWRRFLWPVVGVLLSAAMLLFGLWDIYSSFHARGWRNLLRVTEYEAPLSAEGVPVTPSGIAVKSDTPLEPGSTVLAYSQGQWWRAKVVAVREDVVQIHYPGWDAKWDESVRRSELQVDADASEEK